MDYDDFYFDETGNPYRERRSRRAAEREEDILIDTLSFRSSRREARKRTERMNNKLLR